VKNKPTIKIQNNVDTISAGYILNILEKIKEVMLFFLKKLLDIRKPLVIKNISTEISPHVIPSKFMRGCEFSIPVVNT